MLRRLQPAARPVRVWTATAVFTAFSFHLVALSFLPSMLSLMVRTRLVGSEPSAFTALAFQWIQQVVVLPVMLGVSGIGMLVSAAFCLQLPSLFLLGDARALGVGTAPFLRGAWQGLLLLVVLLPGWYPFTGLCEWILELTGRELAEQATVMLLRLHLELGNHGTLALLGLTAVVCAPLAEELVFRGLLYS
ncbi:MAG: hypothetical protein IH857_01800, partial [Deltaproteobacteria bacterium]|nr:hypothetical protein [Deltaproteobacteria bacterium]